MVGMSQAPWCTHLPYRMRIRPPVLNRSDVVIIPLRTEISAGAVAIAKGQPGYDCALSGQFAEM
jgi:hypothetical protein